MQTEAVFENISDRIKLELWKARNTIHISVAWFTNKELFDILKIKAQNKCNIFLIINDDDINNNSSIEFNKINTKHFNVFKIALTNNELMHNKFCVIDKSIVITGSYNWSYKAQSNFENIVITYDDNTLATQFINEFNKILSVTGNDTTELEDLFPLHILIKRLQIIKNYILLEDFSSLLSETTKIKQFMFKNEIVEICELVNKKEYDLAIQSIDNFINQNNKIDLWEDQELVYLKTEIHKLEIQLNAFDNERTEIEKIISDFQHRHTLELGDIILKILKLRKQKFINLKDRFQEAEQDEKDFQDLFNLESSKQVNKITDKERIEIKNKYRKATMLCHPDKVVKNLKNKAEEIFIELNSAYKQNNLNKVTEILDLLENEDLFKTTSESVTEKDILKTEIVRLKRQIKILENEIFFMKNSDAYKKIIEIYDWDNYFKETKLKLEAELRLLVNEINNGII